MAHTDAARTHPCCVCGLVRAAATIQPLTWEPPYAVGTALKKKEKKKETVVFPSWPVRFRGLRPALGRGLQSPVEGKGEARPTVQLVNQPQQR